MSSAVIAAGVVMAALGFGGRALLRARPAIEKTMQQKMKEVAFDDVKRKFTFDLDKLAVDSKYYKGGFEDKMSRREASLVLGVGQSANKAKIKEAHKRIMLLNHPDRGGSPYLAAKINEAKDLLDK
ncbi:mitochondrial import inner membrane translocase subunit TIM14 [Galendromus occidentalis]|uniref:Mitochondrial import inner membrane translocase subunit TIM14 n=1 Tax=Galendromus occidentalis TaxID=34638 RepID=A0AAJ6QUJ3_9ACAR|nr:mitochondrial import inner membrane translocase subunit TIM14 [Galendromus occidentalis]